MTVNTFVPDIAINFTENGKKKIKSLLNDKDGEFLRVYIEGGGCSGFQYGFKLDDTTSEYDIVIQIEKAKVLVDPMSYQYLVNSEIDYKEDIMGSMFIVQNPQARSTCGCGLSFSL